MKAWKEFLSNVKRTEQEVKGWSATALEEELEFQGYKGERMREVKAFWKTLQGS